MTCARPSCTSTVSDTFLARCAADPSISFKSVSEKGQEAIYDHGSGFCSHDCWRAVQPERDYRNVRIRQHTKRTKFAGLPELHDDNNIPSWMTDDGAPDSYDVTFGD